MSAETSQPTKPDKIGEWEVPPNGTPCWVEIPAVDVKKCKDFYSAVFPDWIWRAVDNERYSEGENAFFSYRKQALSGGIVKVSEGCKTSGAQPQGMGFVLYHMVDSIEEAAKRIESLGGQQITEKSSESGSGYYSRCKDIEGNIFGIYEVKG